MAASSLSSTHLLHHLLRRPPPSPLVSSSVFSFFCVSPTTTATAAAAAATFSPLRTTLFSFHSSARPLFLCNSLSSSSVAFPQTPSPQSIEPHSIPQEQLLNDLAEEEESGGEIVEEEESGGEIAKQEELYESEETVKETSRPVNLTIKEKKELASYAHSLGKKLKCQLVGKQGVTASVASAFIENLESNELLKIKIHGTCPGELPDVVKQLEESTGSVVVGQIGRSVILYRPSVTKLKAEEKRKQARRVYVRKGAIFKPKLPGKLLEGQSPRVPGRGRRGSSRFRDT
ncbi:hypothetical protein VitviT2T_002962 [Vitis vinifera]|uniref:CRM domain-containing protein n=2 Tax=Vitis vinifera TaxID=29760 RepID=D7U5J2_VITVI|eukprot:XP_002265886.1 PREDICTED: uncharacterized protein LOC100243481 [Vitis vinifera]